MDNRYSGKEERYRREPGALWAALEEFGELGDYRILSKTEECVIIRVENETGEGDMILYQVFDGVILMYNDFHMEYYNSLHQAADTMIAVDHCREGSLTMKWENGTYCMKKAGYICVDSRVHHQGVTWFPTRHYHGMTIGFVSDLAEKSLEEKASGIPVDLAAIRKKFCGKEGFFVIKENDTLKRLFADLYRAPEEARIPYFRAKVLELLVCLSVAEAEDAKTGSTYFGKSKIEKTRAVHSLISQDLEHDHTIEELALEFGISRTALKECFKSLYGKPIHKWLREYRMDRAREYLTEHPEMSISEIAAAVGYSSQAGFGAVFKELCGMTPGEYRDQPH